MIVSTDEDGLVVSWCMVPAAWWWSFDGCFVVGTDVDGCTSSPSHRSRMSQVIQKALLDCWIWNSFAPEMRWDRGRTKLAPPRLQSKREKSRQTLVRVIKGCFTLLAFSTFHARFSNSMPCIRHSIAPPSLASSSVLVRQKRILKGFGIHMTTNKDTRKGKVCRLNRKTVSSFNTYCRHGHHWIGFLSRRAKDEKRQGEGHYREWRSVWTRRIRMVEYNNRMGKLIHGHWPRREKRVWGEPCFCVLACRVDGVALCAKG